jgi:hypothetical protein
MYIDVSVLFCYNYDKGGKVGAIRGAPLPVKKEVADYGRRNETPYDRGSKKG